MLLGQELKFENRLCNLKLGTFFSAFPGLGASAPSGRVGQTGQKFRFVLCPIDFTDLHRYNEKKGLYATMVGWRIDPFYCIRDAGGWRHAV